MSRLFYSCFSYFLISSALGLANAQTILTCNSTSVPPIVHVEGIAERIGDIVLNCSGGMPSAQVIGNLSIFLSVNITNRVAGSTVSDVVFTMDNGSGPQPVNVPGALTGLSSLVFNGVNFTLSPTGTATLRIANIRADANQLTPWRNNSIQAFIGFNSSSPDLADQCSTRRREAATGLVWKLFLQDHLRNQRIGSARQSEQSREPSGIQCRFRLHARY